MDEKVQILLGSTKNIHSVDADNYQTIELESKPAEILEYDIKNVLSATEIFDTERDANPVYRIYGRIEYLSLLNGLKLNYTKLQDFFLPIKTGKNIFNSFDFYLLRAANSGYTPIAGSSIEYVRRFEVIATPKDFELYNAGFTNNVYGDQVYAFNFNRDFDITPYVDQFNFPATELFLYAQYKLGTNGNSVPETISGTTWSTDGIERKILFAPTTLITGNTIYGDLIEYSKPLFFQSQLSPQTYYISTSYKDDLNADRKLQWKYNPIIPLRLRYFSDGLNQANTGTTSYEQASSIPYYATLLTGGTGNYIWKDILLQGYIDPITNLGVNYPFVNKKRYLFSTIILDVSPNLNDPNTFQVFTEIKFDVPTKLNTKPISDLSNIGKPCQ